MTPVGKQDTTRVAYRGTDDTLVGWKEEEPWEQQKPGLEKRLLSGSVPKVWAET